MSAATLTTFLAYVGLMFLIAWVAYNRTRNFSDYLLGGRSLSPAVAALSAGASDMSGWLLLGLPGAVYVGGLSQSWIVIGLIMGAWLNWALVARRLRITTEYSQSLTLPDYLTSRFMDKNNVLRIVSASIILLFFTFYTASGLVSGALLFSATFELSYFWSLLIGAVIIVSYTMVGGFLAVSWTDVAQGLLMLLALVVLPMVMVFELGGLPATLSRIESINPEFLSFNAGDGGTLVIISLLAWGLGYFGQPHILTRFMAIDSPAGVPRAMAVGMGWMILSSVAALAIGLVGMAYMHNIGQSLSNADSEKVFILLTQIVFNPWVGGILLAAILAAVMSTIDSQLLVSSSALSEDFYKTLINPQASELQLVRVGRLTVLFISLVAIAIAMDPDSKVLALVSYAWAGLGASFGPVILLSLYYRNMSAAAALSGMVTGAITVIVWKQLDNGLFELYELFPAFLFSCLSIFVVSTVLPANKMLAANFDQSIAGQKTSSL